MPRVSDEITIHRPPAEVFAALADPSVQVIYDAELVHDIEQLTPGPIGKGTRFRGDFKGIGEVDYEYVDFEHDRLIEHGVDIPLGSMRHRFELEVVDGGTRLRQSITIELSRLGRVLWPLAWRGVMKKRVRTLNARVKAYVER